MHIDEFKDLFYKNTKNEPDKNRLRQHFNSFYFSYKDFLINNISKKESILEVGSGHSLLLNYLIINDYNIIGIEPYSEGFESFKKMISIIEKIIDDKATKPERIKLEDYKPDNNFDIILSDNVIEHVDNWQNFIGAKLKILNKGGRIIMYLPNYMFPFELHFLIPIIINKNITSYFYKNRINNFEIKNNCVGLWNSLNFVKFKYIKYELKKYKVNYVIDYDYTFSILKHHIRNRKKKLNDVKQNYNKGILFYFFYTILCFLVDKKILRIIKYFPLFFHPYLKITINK